MLRKSPPAVCDGIPCILAAIGTVKPLSQIEIIPDSINPTGYTRLDAANRLIRKNLSVKKSIEYRRGNRPKLKELHLDGQAIVCVLGHYLYLDRETYHSFFDNENDEVIKKDSINVDVDAMSSKWLDVVMLPDASLYQDHVSYRLIESGETVSQGSVLFCPPKHFDFSDPELTIKVENDEITVFAKHYAKSVEIRNASDDLILSDNFFDMEKGERKVKILKGDPLRLEVRSVYSIR